MEERASGWFGNRNEGALLQKTGLHFHVFFWQKAAIFTALALNLVACIQMYPKF
jgi:hypothetical protein